MSRSSQGQTPAFRGDRLDEEIAQRFLTYEEAAALIGVSVRTLHRWRRGSDPRLKQIRAIAAAFGRDPAYFVELHPPEDIAA